MEQRPPYNPNQPFPYEGGYLSPKPQAYPQSFPQQAVPTPQVQRVTQEIKFYKSGLFGLSSAPGRFQRDVPKMAQGNWRVGRITHLGRNLLGQQTICVVYER